MRIIAESISPINCIDQLQNLDAAAAVIVCRGGAAGKSLLDKLQGYDYDPSAQDVEYPDDSVSQIADDELRVSIDR